MCVFKVFVILWSFLKTVILESKFIHLLEKIKDAIDEIERLSIFSKFYIFFLFITIKLNLKIKARGKKSIFHSKPCYFLSFLVRTMKFSRMVA